MEIFSLLFIPIAIAVFLAASDHNKSYHTPSSNSEQPEPWTNTSQNEEPVIQKHNFQPTENTGNKNMKPKEETENTNSYMPYKKKKLLTYTEYQFYKTMKQACDEKNLLICPKVRLEDFIDVTDRRNRMKYRGYIKSRHVDFIVTDDQLNLLCGIELDDPSHQKPEATKTDAFKNNLFKTIGIPLFRIDTTTKYEIRMNYIFRQLKIIPPTQTYQAEQEAKKLLQEKTAP